MKTSTLVAALPLLLAAGCGGGGPAGSGVPDEGLFVSGVRHSYFPLTPGARWTFEGEEDGRVRREEVSVLPETVRLAGVDCTALAQETWLDGALAETTTEWFAEDQDGSVWKFGEESFEHDGAGTVRTEDSWRAGEDGARAFLAFPSRLRVGDVFHGYRPDDPEEFHVLSLTDSVATPAGAFVGCLRLWENPADVEDADILLYAPGVGRVSETNASGFVVLVALEVP
jgi:hypothetical protein